MATKKKTKKKKEDEVEDNCGQEGGTDVCLEAPIERQEYSRERRRDEVTRNRKVRSRSL